MLLVLLGVGACGSQKDARPEAGALGHSLKWSAGDYPSLSGDVCQQFARLAKRLVPDDPDASLSSRDRRAVCHWRSALKAKRFRELTVKVNVMRPALTGTSQIIPAVEVTRRGFKKSVDIFRKGLVPSQRFTRLRTLAGVGDQATLISGVAHDIANVYMALRVRNVLTDVVVQGSNTRFVKASDGSGTYPVTKPLRRKVVEDVAIASAKHILTIVQRQRAVR